MSKTTTKAVEATVLETVDIVAKRPSWIARAFGASLGFLSRISLAFTTITWHGDSRHRDIVAESTSTEPTIETETIEEEKEPLVIEIEEGNKIDRDKLDPPTKPGAAPKFKEDGTSVEIHHEGQNPKGPFTEMHKDDHRGKGNDKVNHPDKGQPSKIDRKEFDKARREYWKKEYNNNKKAEN